MNLTGELKYAECNKKTWRLGGFSDAPWLCYGDGGLALTLTMARKYTGLTPVQTGRKLGVAPTVNISIAIQRYRQRLGKDGRERALAARAEKMINETI